MGLNLPNTLPNWIRNLCNCASVSGVKMMFTGNIWNLLFTKVQQQHHWNHFYHHLQTTLGCANNTSKNWWHGFESYCCHKRISSTCTYIHGTYNQIQGQTNQWCKLNRKYLPTIKPWYIWNSPIVNSNRSKNCKMIIDECSPYDTWASLTWKLKNLFQ